METSPTIVFQSLTRRDCAERALVLRALGVEHGMKAEGTTWILWVFPHDVERALSELRSYEEERRSERLRPKDPVVRDVGKWGLAAFALLAIAFFPVGQFGLFDQNFWMLGRMDSGRVLQGEWWRTVTALCLHADLGHLAGNLFFGVLFAGLTSQLIGSGLTWLGTLLAGGFGNALTSYLHGPGHLAIGASTAVFGTLGIFAFYEWVRRRRLRAAMSPLQRMRIIAPLMAGAVLFGFLGTGGQEGTARVDVLSHMTGFASGALFGTLLALFDVPNRVRAKEQRLAGIASLALVGLSWGFALWFQGN